MTVRLLAILFLAVPLLARATTPTRYDISAGITSVPATGGASFGTRFLFANGNQVVYRLLPPGGQDSDPATSFKYWGLTGGERTIAPAAGFTALDPRAMNAAGDVVGTMTGNGTTSALLWTAAAGSRTPGGFSANASTISSINAARIATGSTDSSGYTLVRADVSGVEFPGLLAPPVPNTQAVGASASGETLIHLPAHSGNPAGAAVWTSGTTVEPISAVADPDEVLLPANMAINAAGDAVLGFYKPGAGYRLVYVPATARGSSLEFTFEGPVQAIYNVRISDAGVAICEASVNGVSAVSVISRARAEQRRFVGYRAFLNNAGELVFGEQGGVRYWNAAAWTGNPEFVPVSATTDPGGFDLVGFNDEGRLLATLLSGGSRQLAILSPAGANGEGSGTLRLAPNRRRIRMIAGQRGQQAQLTKVRMNGQVSDIRYVSLTVLPTRLRLRPLDGVLEGVPKRPGVHRVRVYATYRSNGVTRRTNRVAVELTVSPARTPTQ